VRLIGRRRVVSRPGAAVELTAIELTPAGERALTTPRLALPPYRAPAPPPAPRPRWTSRVAYRRAVARAERAFHRSRARALAWARALEWFAWSWLCPDRWRDAVAGRADAVRRRWREREWWDECSRLFPPEECP
jgi:hypothetical protein